MLVQFTIGYPMLCKTVFLYGDDGLKMIFFNDKRRKSERYKIIVFSFRDTDIV